jgi:Fic family protein
MSARKPCSHRKSRVRSRPSPQSGQPIDDIREVSNYVDAMMYGLERLEEFPLSLRLIRELHGRLLQSGRGETKDPGEFRRSQNRIGGTRPGNALFVPPPPSELGACLDAFERFIHETRSHLPPLIKAGLLHVQFETIHPFLDGNGRVGRLMVTLFLCANGVLRTPLLYLSLYLKIASRGLLSSFARGPREWRLGELARIFSGGRCRNGESGLRSGCAGSPDFSQAIGSG